MTTSTSRFSPVIRFVSIADSSIVAPLRHVRVNDRDYVLEEV
jgi:hypothetical protein